MAQEKKEDTQSIKELQESIETITNPTLKKIFNKIMTRMKDTETDKEVKAFRKDALKKPKKQEQTILAFLPHQMAKTSIFFPMSKRELKEGSRKITKIEHQTNWGKVVIEGIKLAIFEEDIFLALLYLAKNNIKKFKNDFILEISINKIINLIYGVKGYSKNNRDVILRTLKHFELVSFDLIIGEWEKQGKDKLRIEKIRSVGNIVSGFNYDENLKNLKIYFNHRFFAYFLESMLTNINLTLRRNLKKDGSKALFRFLSTHNQPGKMHILTVLNAINFNTNQPMFKLRQLFKSFINELKKNKVLGLKTKIYEDDIVYFDVLLSKKKATRLKTGTNPYIEYGKPVY